MGHIVIIYVCICYSWQPGNSNKNGAHLLCKLQQVEAWKELIAAGCSNEEHELQETWMKSAQLQIHLQIICMEDALRDLNAGNRVFLPGESSCIWASPSGSAIFHEFSCIAEI